MWLKISLSLYLSLAHHYMYTHTHIHTPKQTVAHTHQRTNTLCYFLSLSNTPRHTSLAHTLSLSLSYWRALTLPRPLTCWLSHTFTLLFQIIYSLPSLSLENNSYQQLFSTEGIRTGYLQDSRKLKTSCEIRFPEQVNRYRINRIFITGNSLPTFTSFKTSKDIFWGGIRTTDVKGRKHPKVPPNLLRLNKESLIIVEFALTTLTRW